ncbi:Reverse transcriptase domain protein [Pyrenophora tritici-repentis]|uniref:Reverse transcriptase domain protein n=1 Tax=Pyrenophora tritici-repentis TaxID=45151 RepID=A0A922N1H3_9PLEO|nr:Reverse transcriptase domain protein [Pyrenophora tritici-repentis]KAI1680427.1 Reverse transcriptase domain protein [Pyrenophora tritici-repentis]
MATYTSSTAVTARLAADGKNWKDWIKQLINYAAADGAVAVLDGAPRPEFDATDDKYRITAMQRPITHPLGTSTDVIQAELDRVGKLNKTIGPFNNEARQLLKEDKLALDSWVARDARLQNTILSSIDKPLVAQVRTCPTAHDMYKALKDLNSNGDYANAALAWTAFIDLRAETQPTVRSYIGKFRETINDITVQGITLGWKKPSAVPGTSADRDIEDLLIIHFLHGLARVLPQWVEARNNDLRQGHTWSIDTLVASLEDHLRHAPDEPVKTFLSVSKQAEEKRVLTRLNGRGNGNNSNQNSTSTPSSLPTRNNNQQKRTPQPVGMCDHCKREHPGPNELCWKLHPSLTPDNVKKRTADNAAKKAAAAAARTNVTVAKNSNDDDADQYDAHSYVTVATFVSPTLLKKAVSNHDYQQRYCYDTAANRHVFNNRSKFYEYAPIDNDVHGSTGSTTAAGVGTVRLEVVKADGTTEKISLQNVLYCPDFATNVISQAPFKRAGVWYHSGKDKLYTASDEELAYLPEIDGIPNFLVVTESSKAPAALSYASLVCYRSSADEPSSSRPATDWHHIMGHAGIDAIKDTAKVVHGMKLTTSTVTNCEPCGLSKSKRNISRIQQTPPNTALGKVHVDVVGPITIPGKDGERYFMPITDGKSRRQWLFTSDSRAVLGQQLINWCKAMKAKGFTITIHTDNAREFINASNKQYFDSVGIEVVTSPPYDATRNGIAERANGITEDRTRGALIAAKLPIKLWPYAAKYMARIHNLVSNSNLPGKITPLEAWNRSIGYPNPVPNVAKMHAFGHVGYAHIPAQKRVKGDKFAPRAHKGHLVGMIGENIYQMWIPETDEIVTTASVRFDSYDSPSTPPLSPIIGPSPSPKVLPFKPLINRLADAATTPPAPPQDGDGGDLDNHQLPRADGGDGFDGFEDDDEAPPAPPTRGNNKAARRHEINADLNPAHIIHGPRNRRARAFFTSSTFDRCFAMALVKPTLGSKLSELPPEPRNYRQFLKHPRRDDLQLAMDDEYNALIANGTWRPATAEEIAKYEIIPGQWVWTYKGNAQGYHVKDKARMVACGNKQQESIWYREVYSYVVRTSTLRILLALVAYFDLECEQIDMITAYLNAHLDDDDVVLLRLPAGCTGFGNIVRLRRGMYGLRQSALLWYNDLKDSLKDLGFEPIEADPCVFVNPTTKAIIVVYVDDLILITRDVTSMKALKSQLLNRYKARDLGPIGFYLGIRILRDRPNRSLSMTMDSYVDRIVDEYHLANAPKADNPLPKSALTLIKRDDIADNNLIQQYQSLVAKLLYPTSIIRCDLAWHVNFMARFANNPTLEQLSLLKHMLRYYNGTATLGIKYQGDLKDANMDDPDHMIGLKAYSDSAHGDNNERKSSSGYVIKMAGGVVSYKSYRQRLVTLSSTESEYIAMTYAAKEINWLQRLLSQVGYVGNDLKPFKLYTDNQPALNMIRKDGHHERTKHIDAYFKYTKQQYKDGNLKLDYLPGVEMPADGLTKPLDKQEHAKFIGLIDMVNVPRM